MVPTGTPAVAIAPRDGQPAETRAVTSKFFSMYVPANFQEASEPLVDGNGEQLVAFDAPSSKPATPVRVAGFPDTKPRATAIEQTSTMEVAKRQNDGVKDFTRSMVKWPGAQSTILLQWTETPAAADEPQRRWQIVAQVNDQLIVNFVAMAPVGEFDTAGLVKIMETFRPHPA